MISTIARRMINHLQQFLVPSSCMYCAQHIGRVDEFLCQPCSDAIRPVTTQVLKITEKLEGKVFAVSDYKDPLRSLIVAKHSRNKLAAHRLGRLLWDRTDLRHVPFDYIVPVPLHWTRYAWRWFNQAEVMAHEIAKMSSKPVVHLVVRKARTISQTGLTRVERKENLANAFALSDQDMMPYKGKHILFIDDVMTTGTTLQAVVKVTVPLKLSGFTIGVACRVL